MTAQQLDDYLAAHPVVSANVVRATRSLRKSATVLSLAQAVVSHGGPDYTDPVTLKAASAQFAAKAQHVLEVYDAAIAQLENAQQADTYGGTPPDFPGTTFLTRSLEISDHMTDNELHAAETFLRSCLTE